MSPAVKLTMIGKGYRVSGLGYMKKGIGFRVSGIGKEEDFA
jgi:hypothetical protein